MCNLSRNSQPLVNQENVELIGFTADKRNGVLICNQPVVGSNPIASSSFISLVLFIFLDI